MLARRRPARRRWPAAPTCYVALNFGTLRPTRVSQSLGARRAARHRARATACCAIGALDDLHRHHPLAARAPAAADAGRGGARDRRRADPEPRHASAATSPTARRPATRCRCWRQPTRSSSAERRRGARCRSSTFYTGYRQSVLQPDELIAAVEIPGGRRRAVVPQGRHARGAGDLEGRDGRRARRRGRASRLAAWRPTVVRLPRTEAALARGASLVEAQRILQDEISPIDDIRSTASYRRRVAANLLAQFWQHRDRTAGLNHRPDRRRTLRGCRLASRAPSSRRGGRRTACRRCRCGR